MKNIAVSLSLLLALSLGCAAELGEPCGTGVSCPSGSVCRDNLYMADLCKDGIVPVEGSGPDGYCTLVCERDADCAQIAGSAGCQHDPRGDRMMCMPDCSAHM